MSFEIPKTKEEIETKIALLKEQKKVVVDQLEQKRDEYSNIALEIHAITGIVDTNATTDEPIVLAKKYKTSARKLEVIREEPKQKTYKAFPGVEISEKENEIEKLNKELKELDEKIQHIAQEYDEAKAIHREGLEKQKNIFNEKKTAETNLKKEVDAIQQSIENDAKILVSEEEFKKTLVNLIKEITSEVKERTITFKNLEVTPNRTGDALKAVAKLDAGVGATIEILLGNKNNTLVMTGYDISAGLFTGKAKKDIEPELPKFIPRLLANIQNTHAKGETVESVSINNGIIELKTVGNPFNPNIKLLEEKQEELRTIQPTLDELKISLQTLESSFDDKKEFYEERLSAFYEEKKDLEKKIQKVNNAETTVTSIDEEKNKINPDAVLSGDTAQKESIKEIEDKIQALLLSFKKTRDSNAEGSKKNSKIDEREEENKTEKKAVSRRKFLKWLGIGLLSATPIATGIGIGVTEKKLKGAKKNLEEADKNQQKNAEDFAKVKKDKEEAEAKQKAEKEKAEQEKIKALVEQMDMPFFESLSYAGKIFYLSRVPAHQTYLMLDKTKAVLYVVGEDNKKKVETIVDLGRVKGEAMNEVKRKHDANIYGTTPSRIYTLSFKISKETKAEFGDKAIWMDTGSDEDPSLCIHPILPNEYKKRMKAINSLDNTDDNRISWGCVNVTNIEELRQYIVEGTNFAVLPDKDDAGNEVWLDPDRGTFAKVGEGDTELSSLLTKVEEYAKIKGDIV